MSAAPGPTPDAAFMAQALALAERGRGRVEPGAVVGAVVVRDGEAIGEGWYADWGGPHAEVTALQAAGDAARGATLYVTLEPCAHHGKTPPCVDAIVAAGVARVVYAAADTDARTAGQGPAALREAGITVEAGVEAVAAARVNGPFLRWTATGLPLVTAKWAMTLDGRIATRSGESLYLTGTEALARAHAERARCGAVVAGLGTVLQDDPLLTVRAVESSRQPVRVVLDSLARLPLTSRLVRSATDAPLLVAVTGAAPADRVGALTDAGAQVARLDAGPDGRVAFPALLAELGRRAVQHVLVEGGSAVLGSAFDAGVVDRVVVFIAGRVAGGATAPPPVGGAGAARVLDATPVDPNAIAWTACGRDVVGEAWLREPVPATNAAEEEHAA